MKRITEVVAVELTKDEAYELRKFLLHFNNKQKIEEIDASVKVSTIFQFLDMTAGL